VHAAVDGGDTPGRASGDQTISGRGKDGLLILVEGLQRRILARTFQLVSTRPRREGDGEKRVRKKKNVTYESSKLCFWFV